jgi:hypothetical protein
MLKVTQKKWQEQLRKNKYEWILQYKIMYRTCEQE